MKEFLILVTAAVLVVLTVLLASCNASCGMSSSNNEAVGQVKKVVKKTPMLCPDYTLVDISLGVMRNGVGSLSREDMELAVDNQDVVILLKEAANSGVLIKFTYDVDRLLFMCRPGERLLRASVIESEKAGN